MLRYVRYVGSAILSTVLLAAPAFADYPPVPPNDPPGGDTISRGGPAFTGAEISLGLVLLAALVIVGVLALVASRRGEPRVSEL